MQNTAVLQKLTEHIILLLFKLSEYRTVADNRETNLSVSYQRNTSS